MTGLETADRPLGARTILIPWLPLVAMWVMMAVEQPAIAAVIARLPDVTIQLGAFGLTFSLALLIEAPIIQLLAAATALPDNRAKYRRLLTFMHFWALGLTAIHALLAIPVIFRFLTGTVMGIPDHIVGPANRAFIAMVPWSAVIGYRRLWQGVLIKYRKSSLIPITMYTRLIFTGAVLAVGLVTGFAEGAVLGALSLSAGTIAGMVASGYFVRRKVLSLIPNEGPGISWPELTRFYMPLALTSIITLGARPLLSLGLARGILPVESLAVWPVVTGFSFLFNSIALSYQEITISMIQGPRSTRSLTRFAWRMGAALALVYLALGVSPLRTWWFEVVAGLDPTLADLVSVPLLVLTAFPFASAVVSVYRGRLVFAKRTGVVSTAVALNSTTMLVCMFLGISVLPFSAVVVASLAYAVSILVEAVYLSIRGERLA